MNLQQVQEDRAQGEGLHREFKEAGSQLPRNLFETVCAFLNTDGGTILLGVADDGTVTGVDPDAATQMKSDLAGLSNNPQKIEPPWLLFPHEFELDGKIVIAVQVPLSSQLHKTGGHIFLRSEDGDYRVQGTHQLAGLLNRKLGLFTEQRALPHATLDDLRPELFDRARRLMRSYNSQHPWADLSNEELLKIGGFYAADRETGKTCLTLAAVLMFGADTAIQQAVPAYKFDCLLRRENVDRYDDRLMIRTNLIDAYDQMMGFVEKHLNDPFYLEGDMRISLRDKIFREAVSNIVSHREYTSAAPARLIIYKDRVILDNPTVQHHFGEITPENLRPFSKNPTICKFMIQLGRFDELGSGVTNINKYLPLYAHGAKPVFRETLHGFELTVPLAATPVEAQVRAQVRAQVEAQVVLRILQACMDQPLSSGQIAAALGHKTLSGNLRKTLPHLRECGLLEYTLPEKPNSRLQKYRLTEKGKQLLEKQA
ncbi:MAG TPA: AAA family ATPase [Verrucomicrobia bacterium]|nr:MAG: AAA family ATPase [Lentisphaerae bacterium GWF2_57_35]HBA84814.1 AAA family ATPase [Verrucomicrobiota bacterium]